MSLCVLGWLASEHLEDALPELQTHTAHVPPSPTGIHPRALAHVVFRTTDPERLVEWYCTVLGAQRVLAHPGISFITWDHSQDRLAFLTLPPGTDTTRGAGGVDHVAFEWPSLADLVTTYRRLQAIGIPPFLCMNHGVATSMYYRDPDGNDIELTAENFESMDALNAWLATGDFDANPGGAVLDAESLSELVESGVPEREILRPVPDHRTWMDEHRAELERERGLCRRPPRRRSSSSAVDRSASRSPSSSASVACRASSWSATTR